VNPVLTTDRAGLFRIWDHPNEDVEYVIGVDVAEGRKKDRTQADRRRIGSYGDSRPDYSAAIVLEVESGLHVATWHGYLTPDEFSTVTAAIGYLYNTALIVPEINGPGLVVVTRLSETIRYPNIYRTRMFNVLDRDPFGSQFGWRTDQHTRSLLIARIHEALNNGKLFTRDQRLIGELRTMEFDDQGVPRARGNDKDDCVLALGMALQGRAESLGQNQSRGVPKKPNEAYTDSVWRTVQDRQRRQDERRRSRNRSSGGRIDVRGRTVLPRPGSQGIG